MRTSVRFGSGDADADGVLDGPGVVDGVGVVDDDGAADADGLADADGVADGDGDAEGDPASGPRAQPASAASATIANRVRSGLLSMVRQTPVTTRGSVACHDQG
jgi:hypothetical protein